MNEYIIEIAETTTHHIRVVADNQDDALSYADMLYLEGDLRSYIVSPSVWVRACPALP